MDALRCPPDDAKIKLALRRRKAPRRALPAAAAEARHPDPRRADEPPRRRVASRWLEQHLQRYEGTVIAVTHDRYFLDNVAGWILELDRGAGHPVEGQLLLLAGAEEDAAGGRGEDRNPPGRRRSPASWNGSANRPSARQAKSKARLAGVRARCSRRTQAKKEQEIEIFIPPGPRLGRAGHRGRRAHQGLRRQAAVRERQLLPAARRHRRHHRPQRRRQDHAVPHDHRPGKAGRRRAQGRRQREARLRRAVARQPARTTRPSGRRSATGRRRSSSAPARR